MNVNDKDLAEMVAMARTEAAVGPAMLAVVRRLAAADPKHPARRPLARAGRGALLGLHLVPGLVLVDLLEHGGPGPTLPVGTVVAEVYGGDPDLVTEVVREHAPIGINVAVVWRPATIWHRLRAWWRERTWTP